MPLIRSTHNLLRPKDQPNAMNIGYSLNLPRAKSRFGSVGIVITSQRKLTEMNGEEEEEGEEEGNSTEIKLDYTQFSLIFIAKDCKDFLERY